MQKELIFSIIAVILIFSLDMYTRNNLEKKFEKINEEIVEIQKLSKEIMDSKDYKDKNYKVKLDNKINDLENNIKNTNKILSMYIEHAELENLNKNIVKIKNYSKFNKYEHIDLELEKSKEVLNLIIENKKIKLDNIF